MCYRCEIVLSSDKERMETLPNKVFDDCTSISTPSRVELSQVPMVVFALLFLSCLLLIASTVHARNTCVNPSVRREWNSLSDIDRAEWINAVKVSIFVRF